MGLFAKGGNAGFTVLPKSALSLRVVDKVEEDDEDDEEGIAVIGRRGRKRKVPPYLPVPNLQSLFINACTADKPDAWALFIPLSNGSMVVTAVVVMVADEVLLPPNKVLDKAIMDERSYGTGSPKPGRISISEVPGYARIQPKQIS